MNCPVKIVLSKAHMKLIARRVVIYMKTILLAYFQCDLCLRAI